MTRPVPRPVLRAVAIALLLGTAVVGCATERPAPTGTQTVAIDGRSWTVLVAGADGMRGRDDFSGADGMLFDMGSAVQPSAVAFVMDGVRRPLALAWFAADGRLVGSEAMVPCATEPCPRYLAPAPFRWAIEAAPGAFDGMPAAARLELSP